VYTLCSVDVDLNECAWCSYRVDAHISEIHASIFEAAVYRVYIGLYLQINEVWTHKGLVYIACNENVWYYVYFEKLYYGHMCLIVIEILKEKSCTMHIYL
jgi:hypothetical protein